MLGEKYPSLEMKSISLLTWLCNLAPASEGFQLHWASPSMVYESSGTLKMQMLVFVTVTSVAAYVHLGRL